MRRVASWTIQVSRGAGELVLACNCRLIDVRKDVRKRGAAKDIGDSVGIGAKRRLIVAPSGRETTVRVVEAVKRQADLLEVVLALRAAGRFAGHLNSGQQERDQDSDN